MQMRKMYVTTNKRHKAAQFRKAAQECDDAGFFDLGRVNWEMSYLLDPPRQEELELEG